MGRFIFPKSTKWRTFSIKLVKKGKCQFYFKIYSVLLHEKNLLEIIVKLKIKNAGLIDSTLHDKMFSCTPCLFKRDRVKPSKMQKFPMEKCVEGCAVLQTDLSYTSHILFRLETSQFEKEIKVVLVEC